MAELKRSAEEMKPAPDNSQEETKSFRLYRPKKEDPEDRWAHRKRRWRVLAGGCFGIGVSFFLGYALLTNPRGTPEARLVAWILIPIFFGVCVRLVVLCFRKKEGDPFYVELEKHAD